MSGKLSHDLLLDSEASLRFADNLVAELRDDSASADMFAFADAEPSPMDLPRILLRAHAEISQVLESLRRSRGILERTTMERVQKTQSKLREVSSATEDATIGMLDGLDRSLSLVDRLDEDAARSEPERAATHRDELRERLHALITSLQFQDITSQQLSYASAVLEDLENRMAAVAALIDQNLSGLEQVAQDHPNATTHPAARHFDSDASTLDAETRQALADEIFVRGQGQGHV
jgi:hypothetical protein